MSDDSKTFREAVEAVRVALADATRNNPAPWRNDQKKGHIIDERGFVVWPGDSNAHTVAILNALPTILDLADEALAHRAAQDAIGDWLERVDQFEADVRRIEQASEDRGLYWLHDLLCDVDYPGQPPEGVMP